MDYFSSFQPHTGICNYLPFHSDMQQNGHHELPPIDHPIEAIGDFASAAGSMLLPSATFNDLQYFPETEIKDPIFHHASSISHRVELQQHLLTPKTDEAPHLIESGLGSYKAYEMNDKFVPRQKTYNNSLKKANVVKGQWAPEEDRRLVKLVEQFGLRKWSYIAQMLPGRVGKQCRERWHNHLRPNIKKDIWSDEEDMVLIQAHKEVGNKWAEIAKRLPCRTENSIKNHWNATKRRQLARRHSRRSSKQGPKSGTLLLNYIKGLGIVPLVQPTSSSFSPATPSPRAGSSKILDSDGILSINEQNHSENLSSEELVAPICDGFSVDICEGLFGTKVDACFEVDTLDGDMNMDYNFNHTDHAIITKVDFDIDMEMLWDNDDTVIGCLDEHKTAGSAEVETVLVKEETDLIEMVAGTQKYGETEKN